LFSLLSKQQQKQQESKRKRREKVREGIKCILSHFKEPIFPRTIRSINSTYHGTLFKVVYDEKEMFRTYEQSEFIDCRVSIYPSLYVTKEYYNDKDINMQVADLITFNVYKPIFMRESAQIKAVYAILQAIQRILTGKPTILRSMGAFHIYQPIEPHPLEQIKEFTDHIIRQYPKLRLILRFPEQKFSSGILDSSYQQEQLHNPSMLLIPGTFDSINVEKRKEEEDEEILLIQKWDGYRPKIVPPIFDFLTLRPYTRYDHQADSKEFLICKWCFWCASHLNTRNVITKCPACDNDGILDSIPISDKEVYEIDSSQKTRIKLESGSNNNNNDDDNNDNIIQTSGSK
jgi:hypothetical protein